MDNESNIITKVEIKDFIVAMAIRLVAWYLPYSIITGLLHPGFQKHPGFGLFHTFVWYALFYFFVARKFILFFKPDYKMSNLVSYIRAHRIRQEKNEEKKAQRVAEERTPRVTPEVAQHRSDVYDDIVTCLADTGFKWGWNGTSTITRLFLFHGGEPSRVFDGTIHYNDDYSRVEFITIVVDGNEVTCRNWPYLRSVGVVNTPIPSPAPAPAVPASAEPITHPPAPRPSEAPVSQPAQESQPQAEPQPEQKPEQAKTEEQLPSVYTDPEIPDDRLAQSVNLIGDTYAARVGCLASVALANKESSITFEWPEGIHSFKEANMLCNRFVESMGFVSGSVDGDNLTMTLVIPTPDTDIDAIEAALNVEVEEDYRSDKQQAPTNVSEPEVTSPPLSESQDTYDDNEDDTVLDDEESEYV